MAQGEDGSAGAGLFFGGAARPAVPAAVQEKPTDEADAVVRGRVEQCMFEVQAETSKPHWHGDPASFSLQRELQVTTLGGGV